MKRPGRFGAHMMTTGGLHQAFGFGRQYGCDVIQVFTTSPQQWLAREVTDEVRTLFAAAGEETGIPCVASHASYLLNLAAADDVVRHRSRDALIAERERCRILGIPGVVIHLGSAGETPEEEAMDRLLTSLREVLAAASDGSPRLLLETTAGQGKSLGHRFEQLAFLLAGLPRSQVGICLDTCHIFVAGYDIRTPESYSRTMEEFDATVGLERVELIHANDSVRELGSRVDRHAHIGQGCLGASGFSLLLRDTRLAQVPVVLETPKKDEMDLVNLAALRRLAGARVRRVPAAAGPK